MLPGLAGYLKNGTTPYLAQYAAGYGGMEQNVT
jgi:hypothetical protein